MAQFEQWFEQDFTKPIEVRHCESVMFTGDDKGAVVGVYLYDNGVAYSGGGTVTGAVKRLDGGLVGLTGTLSGNAASVVIPAAALAYPGPIGVHIILNQGGSVTTVLKAIYSVDDNNSGVPVDPGTIIPSINDLITAINTAVASIPSDYTDLLADIAPDFDATQNYKTGDCVWYNGTLYRFITDHSAGAWASGDVTNNVTLGMDKADSQSVEELQALVWEMLDHEAQNYSGVTASHFAVGPSGKWSYSDTQSSYTIPLDATVKFIKIIGGTNGSIVAFLDTNTQVSGENVDFSTAYSQRITLTANKTKTFVVSGDMNYFYALLSDQSGTDKTPTVYVCYLQTDTTLAARHMPAEAKAVGDAIGKLCINITHDFSGDEETNWVVTAQNIWSKISDNPSRSKTFRIPKNATKITVTGGQYNGVITCLKSYAPAQGAAPDYSTGWARTSITAGATYTYDVGGDCNYLYCTTVSSTGNNLTPTVVITAVRAEDDMLYPVDTETVSESGKHDRADEIMMALNAFGVCRLAPGVYYTGKSIVMPAGTMLQGSGAKTIIRPLASVASISTITMGPRCTMQDLALKGSGSGQRATSSGSRNGIEWTGDTMENGVIQNCTIMNFSGAGIYMHDTTDLTKRNLVISDCYILGNRVGIDIFKRSEFHKICNCTIYSNGIGYRNRGGNNNICNCGIENNITGILIDDGDDDAYNTGHGTITGCSVNHSGSDQYTLGYGLIIKSTGINNRPGTGRMIVSNCNIYYSKLKLENTNGNVITGCGFGADAPWEISGTSPRGDGGCNIFNGCMVKSWVDGGTTVTITDNTATKIVNCFDRSGNAYSA